MKWGLLLLLSGCTTVPPGHVGVWTRWGAVKDGVWPEGTYLIEPIGSDMIKFDGRTQRIEVATSASSRDLQEVTATIVLSYRIQAENARDIYQNIGDMRMLSLVVIEPALQEAVKTATARYTAEQLITDRPAVKEAMRVYLEGVLTESWVEVSEVSITNFSFAQAFQEAIESKQIAEQRALEAERDLVRIRTEAEQAAAVAEGEAQAALARARAEAEAQSLLSQEITRETLQLRAIEKWDGVLPRIVGDGESIDFLLSVEP